jgi:hypothetical protein
MRHISFRRWFDEGVKSVIWFSTNYPIYVRDHSDSLSINFSFGQKLSQRDVHIALQRVIQEEGFDWLRQRGKYWSVDFPAFRRYLVGIEVETDPPNQFKPMDGFDWIDRALTIEPEIEHRLSSAAVAFKREQVTEFDFETLISFKVYRDEFMSMVPMKIFLSHQGADKPLVRGFYETLKALGFDPWLDEAAMPTGTKLERGLKQGFKDSCAAVFFITPNYKDQGFPATEVDYAIEEERAKGDRFRIISIVFKGKKGVRCEVPELLRTHVWKTPRTRLEALRMILQALPIEPGPPGWK